MAKPKLSRRVEHRARPPLLTGALLTVVVVESMLAAWGFVHIGNGSNPSVSLQRYGYGAPELLTLIASCTAAFAWLTYKWKRYGAVGLFVCLGLQLAWNLIWGKPAADLADKLPGQGTFVWITIAFTVAAAGLLWMLLSRLWPTLERD